MCPFDQNIFLTHTFPREDHTMPHDNAGRQAATPHPGSPDNALWQQCWSDQCIDFHQVLVNQLLTRFWPSLNLATGSRVFVPLCGKSLDLIWLASQGHEVVGVELSPIAAQAFFEENQLQPTQRQQGKFTLWEHGKISILCGDYFSLSPNDLGAIDAVYDRAALTALPEEIRSHYLAHLKQVLPKACRIFLLTTEDAEEGETQEQTDAIAEEITTLYAAEYEIELIHVECVFETAPGLPEQPAERAEHKVYQLTPRPAGTE